MLRWIIQIACVLGDLALITACIVVFLGFSWWLSLPIIFATYRVWKSQDGFIAWTHWRQFMKNAKEIGL